MKSLIGYAAIDRLWNNLNERWSKQKYNRAQEQF